MTVIKLLIVDDHPMLRNGLRFSCEEDEELEIVGEAVNGKEAVEMAARLKPDVILMDIKMPEMDGIDASERILLHRPRTRIILLTMLDDMDYVARAIRLGVSGYLLKNNTSEEMLKQSIHTVFKGGLVLDRQVTPRLPITFNVENAASRTMDSRAMPYEMGHMVHFDQQLTTAEQEVLRRVSLGQENKQIALSLCISEKTVANHLSSIYRKIGVSNRVQAALYALRLGLA